MPTNVKVLYAMELDISMEAAMQGSPHRIGPEGYWVIHAEQCECPNEHLCVYETPKEAKESAKDRDHESRVTRFIREDHIQQFIKLEKQRKKAKREKRTRIKTKG